MNTEIIWDFKLEAADIGFAVFYNEKPVRAYIRCNSGFGKFRPSDESDTKVKLIFDNSYSIFRLKNIRLAIQIKKYDVKKNNKKKQNDEDKAASDVKKKKKNSIDGKSGNNASTIKNANSSRSANGRSSPKNGKGEKKKKKKIRVAMID